MRLIIAGSRTIDDYEMVNDALLNSPWAVNNLQHGQRIEEIVHGGAEGVDTIAGEVAEEHDIPVKVFDPQWEKYGKAAGPERNRIMAQYSDSLMAIWDGESKGTEDMIEKALSHGLDVYVKQSNGRKIPPNSIKDW